MPPRRGGKSFVTISTLGTTIDTLPTHAGLRGSSPRNSTALCSVGRLARSTPHHVLRLDRPVQLLQVPASQRDLFHGRAWHRRVNEIAVADVHADVRVAVEAEYVARLQVLGRERTRGSLQRYRRQAVHLVVTHPGDRNSGRSPGRHHQARAVEAVVARTGGAPDVGAADLLVGEFHGLVGLRAHWPGVLAASTARAAAARAAAARRYRDSLGRAELSKQGLLLPLQGLQVPEPLVERVLELQDASGGLDFLLISGQQLMTGGEVLTDLSAVYGRQLAQNRRLVQYRLRRTRREQRER